MKTLKPHFENLQLQRDLLAERLEQARSVPRITFMEVRSIQRELENVEHQLMWFSGAHKGWTE